MTFCCHENTIQMLGLVRESMGMVLPNYAFERPVKPITPARGQRAPYFAPSARLGAQRPAAQRER